MPFIWCKKVHYSITGIFHVAFIYIIDLEKFILKLEEVVGLKCPLVTF